MIRATMKSAELAAPPASSALTRNSTAASIITLRRPIRSASRPGAERARSTSRQDRADIDADPELAEREGGFETLLRAVDDARNHSRT